MILAIVNQKGGVGKTTTAINLAYGLQQHGNVLLIDFDGQGNCATALRVTPEYTITDVLSGSVSAEDAICSTEWEGVSRPNLWLLAANNRLSEMKEELMINDAVRIAMSAIRGKRDTPTNSAIRPILEDRLGRVARQFDYVVIDCPPAHDSFSDAVYQLADSAIVPVKTDYLGTVGAQQHVENIRHAQLSGIDIRIHTVLPTFFVRQQILDREIIIGLEKAYGKTTIGEPIPRSQALAESIVAGLTIFEYAPDSPGAEAYQQLVSRVTKGNKKR